MKTLKETANRRKRTILEFRRAAISRVDAMFSLVVILGILALGTSLYFGGPTIFLNNLIFLSILGVPILPFGVSLAVFLGIAEVAIIYFAFRALSSYVSNRWGGPAD